MKINYSSLKKSIDSLIQNNSININVADMLLTAFQYVDLVNKDEIKQYVKEGKSESAAILSILYEFYDLNQDDEENISIMNEYFLNQLKKLNPKEYQNNPYVKAVKQKGSVGKYSLKELTYEPYQLFAYDEIKLIKDGYKEYSQIGYFDNKFSYLALCEGNDVWMSLNPNEIETMKPYISSAKGDVLVLGLGMGYVPFMLALKDDVKSVTIIEKDPQIIAIFNKLIWPSFKNKEKIKIIQDDAISYTSKKEKCARHDYIFADLWHDPNDGLAPFIKLKRNEKLIGKEIHCWLELSLVCLLRRCMISLIEENRQGFKDEDYRFAKNETDRVINRYYQKTKNLTINDEKDLSNLLSEETLLSLII